MAGDRTIDLAGVLPSGTLYRGKVSPMRVDIYVGGVHYWVWANTAGLSAGWTVHRNREAAS
jgi:hypothetical protein